MQRPAVSSGLCALVLGGSGEVGREILREVASNPAFTRIISIGRRELDLTSLIGQSAGSKIEQRVVNFDALDEHKDAFKGCEIGFCALGTTKAKAGSAEAFVKIDHDYAVNAAKKAKEAGIKQFHIVTAQGSNKNSLFLYAKTKGLIEEDVKALAFDRLAIYRPGLLMCDRENKQMFEGTMQTVARWIDGSRCFSVPTSDVAKVMIKNALDSTNTTAVQMVDQGDIVRMAKEA